MNDRQKTKGHSQRSDVILKSYQKTASILGVCKSFSGASSQKYIKLYNNRPGEQTSLEPHDHQIYM